MQSADEVSKDEQSSPQIESSEPEPKLKPDADVEVVIVADLEEEEGIKSDIRSDRVEDSVPSQQTVEQTVLPELKKDEGNRTFTMRELITELKEGDFVDGELRPSGNSEAITPYSQNSGQARYSEQNDIAMDLINSVKGVDEEGRSRQCILTFAAKRYASAIERNPDDYDALYNWALVLQAFYNWAVAISNRVKM